MKQFFTLFKCCLLVIFLLSGIYSPAQTTLTDGDIAFTRINGDADSFSFVALTNIASSTAIYFSDEYWDGSEFESEYYTILFTATSDIDAGDEVHIVFSTLTATFTSGTATGTLNDVGASNALGANFIQAAGDNIMAFQGSIASPVFIAAISSNTGVSGTSGDAWQTASASYNTKLPAGKTNGQDGYLGLFPVGATQSEVDNARYKTDAPHSGDKATLLSAIMNLSNWEFDPTNFTPYSASTTAFTVLGGNTKPTVTTTAASSISSTSATLGGNVTTDGGATVTGRGVVYSTTDNTPTIGEGGVTQNTNGSGTGTFSESISSLPSGTVYYFQAYAINTEGTSYGGVESFTTLEAPTVTTQAVSAIAMTTATGNGNITDLGVPNPTQHGVCWSTSTSPTIAGSKIEDGSVSSTGAFTSSITGLTLGTTYYVRAYATNDVETSYGSEVSFTTTSPPVISNLNGDSYTYTEGNGATNIDQASALTVTDADSPSSFDGGNLTVTITSGEDAAEDKLSLNSATVTLSGTTAGSNVTVSSSVIGTLGNNIAEGNDLVVNFNSNSTLARVQTLVQAITYENTDTSIPTTGARTVRTTVNDGTNTSLNNDVTITVAQSNDDPSILSLPTDITVSEDIASNVDLSAASLSDVDAGASSIVLTITAASGTLTASTSGFVTIGGSGTGTLSLTGTVANIDAYLNTASNIKYTGVSNVNGDNASSLSVTANDNGNTGIGGGTNIALGTVNVDITAINDAPSISINSSTLAYTENATATAIDAAATVSDSDGDADWDGGKLEVQITANNEAADEISISDTDGDGTAITISGTNILSNGTDIGDLNTSEGTVTNGTKLTITFDSDATNANVQEVLQSICYRSTSDDPGTSNRTVTFTATDNNSGSNSDTRTIGFTPINDEPTLAATGINPAFTEGGGAAVVFGSASASTVESGQTLSAFSITVTNVNDGSYEILLLDGTAIMLTHGTSGTTASNSLSYSVSVSGTTASLSLSGGRLSTFALQSLVNEISYQNNSQTPNTSDRVVSIISLTDSGVSTGSNDNVNDILSVVSTLTVLAVNDAPTISINSSTLAYTEDDAAIQIDAAAALSDLEGDGEWAGGELAIQITNNSEAADEISISDTDGDGIAITVSGSDIFANLTDIGNLSHNGGIVTGAAQLAIYFNSDATNGIVQEVLQSLRYRNTSDNLGTLNRTATITAKDNSVASASDTRTISVTSLDNDAPIITTNNTLSLNEAASATISSVSHLSASDADDDDASLVFTMTTNASNGALKKSGITLEKDHTFTQADLTAGNMTYVHDGTNTISDSFGFKVSDDGNNVLTNQTFSIDVTPLTQFASLTHPNTSSTDNSNLYVDFSLPEAASPGTLKMTFARTGGTADGFAPHVITFATGFETAARHITTLDGTNLSVNDNVESVNTEGNDALVDGAIYNVTVEYQDVPLNASAPMTSTGFTYDNASQLPTLASPATDSRDDASLAIDFSLPEAASLGTVKMSFERTGGTVDGNAPHVLTFVTGFESAAQHTTTLNGADLSSDINVFNVSSGVNDALVNGAIYSVKLEYRDLYWNSASFVSHTGFTYDLTTQTPTLSLPAVSSSDNATLAIDFSLPEAASPGTVKMTFSRTGGTDDGDAPHIITFKSGFETAAQHTTTLNGDELYSNANVLSVSPDKNDFLVNGAIYSVKIAYQDVVGNSESSSTNTVFTYDLNYAPSVTTEAVSSISKTAATGNGTITDLGFPNPTEHGVCWSTGLNPTLGDSHTEEGAVSATGTFTSSITGLTPGTTYHVRSYATNTSGTRYGDDVTFTAHKEASVTTQAVSSISTTTVTANGNITDLGVPNPTQHGFCWNTGGSPTTTSDHTSKGVVSATGTFTSDISGLSDGTTYHLRAYATNEAGTTYGNEVSFTTQTTPTVQATDVEFAAITASQMDASWTRGNGSYCIAFMKETSSGSGSPTDNTSFDANPIFGSGTQIGSTGWYCVYKGTENSVTLTELEGGTTYLVFVCEYNGLAGSELYNTTTAVNNPGSAISLMTPKITTQSVSNITSTTATGHGTITDLGLPNPTEHGVCWSTSTSPTISDNKTEKGSVSSTGTFTSDITGLMPATTYYLRSYSINEAGTAYGSDVSFTTSKPTIAFNSVSSNGSETLGSADLRVDLSTASSFDVSVNYMVTGTATGGGVDYILENGMLTIPAGSTTSNITIASIVNDLLYERNETVVVTLSDPINATFGTYKIHSYSINNDDAAPKVTLSVSHSEIGEIEENFKLIATLSEISSIETQVFLETSGTATVNFSHPALGDYIANADHIYIVPGDLSNFLEVSIIHDNVDEGNETIIIDVKGCDDGIEDGIQQQIVTIIDDDVAGFTLTETDEKTLVSESGDADSFKVTLDAQPISDVVLNILSEDTDEAMLDQASITFTNSNWNSPQTINLSGVDDAIDDGDQNTLITLSINAVASDDRFGLVSNKTLTVITEDDDESPVVSASQSFAIAESIGNSGAVGTALATDADAGTSFSSWTETGGTGAAIFEINALTGAITVIDNSIIDYETTTSYTYTVTVSDGTNTSAVETITINITDVNDVNPVITASQSFNINEDEVNTTSLGTVAATDGDITATTFSTWTITAGNTNSVFAINGSTGEITVNDADELDYETITSYTLTLTVSDGTNTSATETTVVDVNPINDNNPVVTASQSFDIAENIADAAAVGAALATDADAGTSFSSWTETGGTGAAIFEINALTGAITVIDNSIIDYETTTSYTYTVTVSDGTNTSAVETITINITDVNDVNPVVTASQSFNIDEDAVNTNSVGTVVATDRDVTATTYSSWTITAGNTNSVFAINASTGEITVNDVNELDYEVTTSYNLTVTVSDGINTSATEIVVVNVNDINDNAPVVSPFQIFTIDENLNTDNIFGSVNATDEDSHQDDLIDWKILNGNINNAFTINAHTGQISINNSLALDRESFDEFELEITVRDGELLSEPETITIQLNDLNDNRPVIATNQTFNLDENSVESMLIGKLAVTDADVSETVYQNWTITSFVDLDGNGNNAIAIDPDTGELRVNDPLDFDFEKTQSFSLLIKVSDGTGFSLEEEVIININNLNDNVPNITANQNFSITENSANATSLGTVLATDRDVMAATFSDWTITAGNTNSVFAINSLTGELTVNYSNKLDYESTISYVLSVTVSDGLNTSIVEDLIIVVNNVNEVPSAIQLSNPTIAENTAIGTEIGILTTSDVDANQTFTYLVADIENFKIVGDKLVSKTAFDFETQNTYAVEITVTDQGGLTYNQSFSIQISDENEAPIAISLSNVTIIENSAIGKEVGELTATDVDADQTFTYSLADNTNFAIVGDKLVSISELDFEVQNSYSVEITGSDQGGLTHKQNFIIEITDENEAPTAIALSNATITENATIETEVGELSATDVDADQTFTYSISENKYFEIEGDKIVSKEVFNFEDHISYSVKVIVTDQSGLSYDDRFTLQVVDVNEAPEFLSDPLLEAQSGENYTYMIEYHDDDESGCNLTAIEIPSWLKLENNEDGTAILSGIPTEAGTFNVILEASDNEYTTEQEFTIIVETVTGIEDVIIVPTVRIYPNPVVRELHIDLSDFRNDEITISLHSMTGSLVFKEEHQSVGRKVKLIKSVQQLQSGVYLLLIESEGYRKSYKIVKQ